MFRTAGDQPSLWESKLPAEVLRLPDELSQVDALLDDSPGLASRACRHAGHVLDGGRIPMTEQLRSVTR